MADTHDHVDVAVIGGAVMGSAAAFWLSRLSEGRLRVRVIEADPGYREASTALSVASIRQQFSTEINIKISRFGIAFIRDIARETGPEPAVKELGLIENGYLFLAGSEARAEAMRAAVSLQRAEGAGTEILQPEALAARFPHLALDDVVMGSFGPRDEGWFDNMGLVQALKSAARQRGVSYVQDRVTGLRRSGDRVTGLRLASGTEISAGAVINAAGTRGADILRMLGEDMPVEPRKRTVFLIDAPNLTAPQAPLMVDHTGFYLRPEGRYWLCATVPEADGPVAADDFDPDHALFEDQLWPRLYARVPACDAVKVIRCWAGHYAFNTFDQNALVGRWPGLENFYVMNGFSGHGLQQAPAVGRGIAELILHGGYRALDLSPLSPERLSTGRPLREAEIV
ncbi:FAD-dependent oxidoreductase domain-containing protein 1 [Rhodovulum iodosum]|uniref:FAD-dependent oxidoreductase domain-containing protein 1 n=1 Tax=Rhodovulum iodosum TaxID=68291 RepID=A0ABV3XXC0_9RHOB|nr:FAD-binding oxidoreductase [Rhodovulum robiginosum]RSK35006.1 FAD-binding oxidoreductase [Rhodovulum robiginosum]